MNQAVQTCVLMFHGIGAVSHDLEPGEADYWIDWALFDEIVAYSKCTSQLPFEFTFDDGNSSDVEAAIRLHREGIVGSFFVLVGRVGEAGYLSREDLRAMIGMGMEIGLHGRDHVDWRRADDIGLRREIDDARAELAELCGREIDTLAIPYGHYNRRVWSYLKVSSFRRIHTSDRGLARAGDRFVRRNPVMREQRITDIDLISRGSTSIAMQLRRTVMAALKRTF